MLKIREDLRTTQAVRDEVQEVFRHVTNTDKPVMRDLKDELAEYVISNDWANLKRLREESGEAAIKQGISKLVTGDKRTAFSAAWKEINWAKLEVKDDELDYLEISQLSDNKYMQFKNSVFIANEMIETLAATTYNSYTSGLMFADAINDQIESVEFWSDEAFKEWHKFLKNTKKEATA